jgi:hypothetical protein
MKASKSVDLYQVSEKTNRLERHWLGGRKQDLDVYRVPIAHLYFNIENGRYADKMLRLKRENPGKIIDPREEHWKAEIEKLLAGEHKDTQRDKSAFTRLVEDIQGREQLRPGVLLIDGGVLDGNRRLAALRHLYRATKNAAKWAYFDAVILPADTSAEDRWRIEAGLQLGIDERWAYPPVNELIKVRQGIEMYEQIISEGKIPRPTTPAEMVAKAIYGRTKEDIEEMASRLQLMDEYLAFIEQEGAYDLIGESSEDFLEARKIVAAAENQGRDPRFLARLKAVLFYVIHFEIMNNYELRDIYHALGGDPRRRGRKREANEEALGEFLSAYPEDPRKIRETMLSRTATAESPSKDAGGGGTAGAPNAGPGGKAKVQKAAKRTQPQEIPLGKEAGVDRPKVEAAAERFKRKLEAAVKRKRSARTFAEGALADMQNLERSLDRPEAVTALTPEDKGAIRDALRTTERSVATCLSIIR